MHDKGTVEGAMTEKRSEGRGRKVKVYADYTRKCEGCGAKPVVSMTGLCGPCTFGEASCADPAEWEGEYESKRAGDRTNG
jgi:hypothetical protein